MDAKEKRKLLIKRLLREIKAEYKLNYLVIDMSVYEDELTRDKKRKKITDRNDRKAVEVPEHYYKEKVGACNAVNKALIDDKLITDDSVYSGEGTCISFHPLIGDNKILLQYGDCTSSPSNTTTLLKIKYTQVLKEREDCEYCEDCEDCEEVYQRTLQCFVYVIYLDYDYLPYYVQAFTEKCVGHELEKEFHEWVEGTIKDMYPNLFKLLEDKFTTSEVELHIKIRELEDAKDRLPF